MLCRIAVCQVECGIPQAVNTAEDMPQKPLDAHRERYNVDKEDLGT